MNDNLNFGIHFDLEKGLKDAQADWAKVEKQLQTMIGNKNFSVGGVLDIKGDESISKIKTALAGLANEWNNMSNSIKFDKDGQFSSKANEIIKQYNILTNDALNYGQTLQQLTKTAQTNIAEEIKLINQEIEANKKSFEYQKQLNVEKNKKKDNSDLEYQRLISQYAEKEYAQNRKNAQANSELYAQKQQQKQVAEQEYELLKAKYRLQEQDQEAKQRQRNIELANRQNQIEQANYNKIRSAGLSKQKILQAEENSLAAINAKLKIQQERLQSAEFGGAKFNKINSEIQRLTTSYQTHTAATNNLSNAQNRGIATTKTQTSAYSKQAGMLDSLKRSFAAYTGLFAVMQIVRNIREVTASFELQRVALGAIIQDTIKADLLFSQIKTAALESPFQVKELVTYTKQLAAYRIETDDLFDTTMRLADISAGLGVEMDRLVLAYGQVKSASVLRGQELRQFTEAGIPLVQLLADKFSILNGEAVSTADVFDLISKRAVSFGMVKDIFEDMTNAGGIFYDMQRIQSKTLAGSWSNLKDAADIAMNEIGTSQLDNMKAIVDITKDLISNWEKVFSVVEGGVITLTTYKVAVMVAGMSLKFLAQTQVLAARTTTLFAAGQTYSAVATWRATIANNAFIRSLWKLYAAILRNPYAWIAAAAAAAASIIYKIITSQSNLEKVTEELGNISLDNLSKAQQLANDFNSLAKAVLSSAEGSKEQSDALKELQRTYKDILPSQNLTIEGLKAMKGNYDEVTKAIYAKIAAQNQEMITSKINEELGADVQKNMEEIYKSLRGDFYYEDISDSTILKFIADLKKQILDGKIVITEGAKGYVNAYKKIDDTAKKYGMKVRTGFAFGSDFKDLYSSVIDYNTALSKALILNNETFADTSEYSQKIANLEKTFNDFTLSMVKDGKNLSQDEIKLEIGEFSYNEQINKLKIWNYKKFLEREFIRSGIELSVDDFIKWEGKSENKIPKKIFDILKSMTETSPQIFKAAQQIKGSISNMLGSTDQQQLTTRIKEIALVTGYSMDNASKFLKGNEESWKDWSEKITESLKSAKFTLNEPFLTEEEKKKAEQEITIINAIMSSFAKMFSAPKGSNKPKDTRAEKLKEELTTLEKIKKQYDEIAAIKGSGVAKEEILKLYDKAKVEKALGDMDKLLKEFETKAKKIGGDSGKTFAKELADKIKENTLNNVEKALTEAINQIKSDVENQQAKFDLVSSLISSGLSSDEAFKMIMGSDMQEGLSENIKAFYTDALTKALGEIEIPEGINLALLDIDNWVKGKGFVADGKLTQEGEAITSILKKLQDLQKTGLDTYAKVTAEYATNTQKIKSINDKASADTKTFQDQKAKLGEDELAKKIEIDEQIQLVEQTRANGIAEINAQILSSNEKYMDLVTRDTEMGLAKTKQMLSEWEKITQSKKLISGTAGSKDALWNIRIDEKDYNLTQKQLDELLKKIREIKKEVKKSNPFVDIVNAFKEGDIEKGLKGVSEQAGLLQGMFSGLKESLVALGMEEETSTVLATVTDLETTFQGISGTAGGIAKIMSGDIIGGITDVIKGLTNLGTGIYNLFSGQTRTTAKANKEIKAQEKILANLERSYKKLQEASEKAFGVEWLKDQEAELQNLKAQQIAYEKQAQAERSKGKDKDEDKLAEYEQQALDAADTIAEAAKNRFEKFTGTTETSLVKDFASAYLDAYIAIGRQGAITTDELKNQWRSLVKNMVVESFVASAIQGAFQQTFEDITKLYENSKIPTAEEINALTQQGAGVIDILGTTLPQLLEGLDLSGLGDASSELSGLSKSISGATEQEINTLSAAINTQNFYLFTMMTIMKKWDVDNVTQTTTMTNLFTIQNSFLQELPFIRQNTENTVTACNNIAATCNDIKSTLNAVTQIRNTKKCVNTIVN